VGKVTKPDHENSLTSLTKDLIENNGSTKLLFLYQRETNKR